MRDKAWIGIDPGKTGSAALITRQSQFVSDWPGDPGAAADILRQWSLEHEIELVALERVHSMPRQGIKSTFSFGQNFGQWQGVIAALCFPCLEPRPSEWQKGLVRPSDGPNPKARSLNVARRLFPDVSFSRKKDHNKADALLLAWWAKTRACIR